jgi:hypothetical protein
LILNTDKEKAIEISEEPPPGLSNLGLAENQRGDKSSEGDEVGEGVASQVEPGVNEDHLGAIAKYEEED